MSRAQLEPLYAAMANAPQPAAIADLRAGMEFFFELLNARAPDVAAVHRADIGPGIAADVIVPPGNGPFSTLVYFHGGGWSIGSTVTHAKLARQLAVGTGAVVVNVDYRLAPEHPFPAPYDDCVSAVRWTVAHVASYGGDPTRLAIGGDSAGGNLTAAVIGALRGSPPVHAALLFYGAFDLVTIMREHAERCPSGVDPILGFAPAKMMVDAYLSSGADPDDARVSPLRGDLSQFPPACCIVGDADPIINQTLRMHAALVAAGRSSVLHRYPDMPHAFVQLEVDEGTAAIDVACRFLRTHLG
jgi:acetyl esterase